MKFRRLILPLLFALGACAPLAVVPSISPGVPTAELNDSMATDEDGSNPRIFAITAINGVSIKNAVEHGQVVGFGAGGMRLPYMIARTVEAKQMTLKVVGTHIASMPLAQMIRQAKGTYQTVEGKIDFLPSPGVVYRIVGLLAPTQSELWIEEFESGKPVTERLILKSN